MKAHVQQFGMICPGFNRSPHRVAALTGDHRIALANGGELLDQRNVDVLCRECNSRRGVG